MRTLGFILFGLMSESVFSQSETLNNCPVRDSFYLASAQTKDYSRPKEILSEGFLDFYQNGQINASVRVFKLVVGEPYKFHVPISILVGVNGNNFKRTSAIEEIASAALNPNAGLGSILVEGASRILSNEDRYTYFLLQYHSAVRVLSVYNENRRINDNFSNMFLGFGIKFFTRAWEKTNIENPGAFWINTRFLFSASSPIMLSYFPQSDINNAIFGYSAGLGIEIKSYLNVRVFSFHFITNRDVSPFSQPVVQVSFNYSTK